MAQPTRPRGHANDGLADESTRELMLEKIEQEHFTAQLDIPNWLDSKWSSFFFRKRPGKLHSILYGLEAEESFGSHTRCMEVVECCGNFTGALTAMERMFEDDSSIQELLMGVISIITAVPCPERQDDISVDSTFQTKAIQQFVGDRPMKEEDEVEVGRIRLDIQTSIEEKFEIVSAVEQRMFGYIMRSNLWERLQKDPSAQIDLIRKALMVIDAAAWPVQTCLQRIKQLLEDVQMGYCVPRVTATNQCPECKVGNGEEKTLESRIHALPPELREEIADLALGPFRERHLVEKLDAAFQKVTVQEMRRLRWEKDKQKDPDLEVTFVSCLPEQGFSPNRPLPTYDWLPMPHYDLTCPDCDEDCLDNVLVRYSHERRRWESIHSGGARQRACTCHGHTSGEPPVRFM
ncbi:hypothetical protein M409DRAFT_55366 [Zasmidium cellare ATCC 36951]|uniref:Uncharacterized protein n=1 Tax=Zasmidium cellare ATCC 36951 TaxID=1080233 RepID=A0A6A6CFU3_ZASCE|nr:uncharacterized protein M409DRAFT_55366 [Zasmidium cellare ATCC 36951]KAF2166015.1 hypothetical protein M409DRAFT_55366 [Zasmidium cellare ATCC 36951]